MAAGHRPLRDVALATLATGPLVVCLVPALTDAYLYYFFGVIPGWEPGDFVPAVSVGYGGSAARVLMLEVVVFVGWFIYGVFMYATRELSREQVGAALGELRGVPGVDEEQPC